MTCSGRAYGPTWDIRLEHHSKEFCGAQEASSKAQSSLLRAQMEAYILGLHLGRSTETDEGLEQDSGRFEMGSTKPGGPVHVRGQLPQQSTPNPASSSRDGTSALRVLPAIDLEAPEELDASQYEFLFTSYLLPRWGEARLRELKTIELQAFFNSFHPRLSPKAIRLMHGGLRTALNQAVVWELIPRNPAIGVKLPRKKVRKPPVLLSLPDIRWMIEALPEPSKSIVTLIVFASLRVGRGTGAPLETHLEDRLAIEERVYDGEFDDVKTDAGHREVPFDERGVIRRTLERCRNMARFLEPEDLVFANRAGNPIDRHNLLNRQIKPTALKLGLPNGIDFRSFRTMHSSLMLRTGARPEVTRDNMGHAQYRRDPKRLRA